MPFERWERCSGGSITTGLAGELLMFCYLSPNFPKTRGSGADGFRHIAFWDFGPPPVPWGLWWPLWPASSRVVTLNAHLAITLRSLAT
jgi:hypothetical protein